ncbi:lipoprotein-releasing system ATP-binding protein [Schleiferia thermophila]|uniref:Lipoprotein-releasing system ATP-binding protein n=1 Tax=Schleiferia thermophila TaxID=884107 RepID=A0A369A8G1_9FLAO|nr:lipoprotein-releasing system ATP-binding protein [Schleiferia thermophila]GCD79064.1 lipoprotein-releasing system ATP-binding protein LolD [Schleiferia thermophila]
MTSLIRAKNISKTYGTVKVLNDISVSIPKSRIVSIVGPSGAGKSTLLSILGALEKADTGDVFFEDVAYASLSEKKLAALKNKEIGFVFQFHHLLPEFTAVENVAIPAMISGLGKKEAEQKAIYWLEKTGLSHRLKHKPAQLSGGEQQRVAIARALINHPKIVMADEPTGNLDTKNTEHIIQIFKDLNSELGITFLIVTHNENLARSSDEIIFLRDGKIQ